MKDQTRRFIFHGAACAISGHMFRPPKIAGAVEAPASAALTVAGGYARSDSKKKRLASWLTIGGASAVAEGNFNDKKQAIEMSWHRVPAESVPTTTRVATAITDFDVKLETHRLGASTLRSSLVAASPVDKDGPSIRVGKDTDVKGFNIDGFPLKMTIDRERFDAADTYPKAARAFGNVAPGTPILVSIVSGLAWAKKPHPTATIEGHVVHVPNFGRIYFGEMLITPDARRLTIVRLALGCPEGGGVGIGDVHTDGSWYPP
jgi:hypothetical protein